ncbi:MAG: hypothetical protein U5N58_01645 [Actinomycetota bacterium]|nr:hypothetical protein [Actinomycetota bacterium]
MLEQVRRGTLDKILMSHDLCFKILLTKFWRMGLFLYYGAYNTALEKEKGMTQDV